MLLGVGGGRNARRCECAQRSEGCRVRLAASIDIVAGARHRGEVALGYRLAEQNGTAAEVVVNAGDERTLRLAITAQLNPPQLPPTLRAR